MARFSALLDACVLVPVVQADTLLRLAEIELYRPLWSDTILDEVVRAVERIHPNMKEDGSAKTRVVQMKESFEDASVTGWKPLFQGIDLPDDGDRHVVAAAIRGRADAIVTANVKDFPKDALGEFDLLVQSPDEFLLNQLDLDPQKVMAVLSMQANQMQRPKRNTQQLIDDLEHCGAREFARVARGQLWRVK